MSSTMGSCGRPRERGEEGEGEGGRGGGTMLSTAPHNIGHDAEGVHWVVAPGRLHAWLPRRDIVLHCDCVQRQSATRLLTMQTLKSSSIFRYCVVPSSMFGLCGTHDR